MFLGIFLHTKNEETAERWWWWCGRQSRRTDRRRDRRGQEEEAVVIVDPQTGGALGSIDEPKLRPSGGDLRGLLRTTRTADEDSRTAGDSIEERVRGGADATDDDDDATR